MGHINLNKNNHSSASSNTEKLFVYGLLSKPVVQGLLIGRKPFSYVEELTGFTLIAVIWGQFKYPMAIPSKSGTIWGSVLELTPQELDKVKQDIAQVYSITLCRMKSGDFAWVFVENPFLHDYEVR